MVSRQAACRHTTSAAPPSASSIVQ